MNHIKLLKKHQSATNMFDNCIHAIKYRNLNIVVMLHYIYESYFGPFSNIAITQLMQTASQYGKIDVIEYLFINNSKYVVNCWPIYHQTNCLVIAIQKMQWNIIIYFIKKGVCDLDRVMWRCIGMFGNEYMVQYIDNIGIIDKNKALLEAIRCKQNTIAKYFAVRGANDWNGALTIAKESKNEEMIEYCAKKTTV